MSVTPSRARKSPTLLPDTDRRARHLVTAAVVIVACVGLYHGGTIADTFDVMHPETSTYIRYTRENIHSLAECFTAPSLYAGLYRPLTGACYIYVSEAWFGGGIAPLKTMSVAVFLANAFLLFLVCRRLFPFRWALVAVVLFTTRRAHEGNLLYALEFHSLLSVFFCLLALYFLIRSRSEESLACEVLSYVSFVLALLSKESAAAMVGVVLVFGLLYERRREWRPYLVHAVLAAGWLRWYAFDYRGGGHPVVHFQYSYSPLDILHNAMSYALSFINPLVRPEQAAAYSHRMDIVSSPAAAFAVVVLFAVAGVTAIVVHRRLPAPLAPHARAGAFALWFFLIMSAPYVVIHDRLFLRYSYVGHIGISMLVTALACALVAWISAFRSRKTGLASARMV